MFIPVCTSAPHCPVNPVHNLLSYFLMAHFNIILLTMAAFFKLSLSFTGLFPPMLAKSTGSFILL